MSTILDALKKSEQERKLKAVPRLADSPPPAERSAWPMWVLTAAIVLLALGLVYVYLSVPKSVSQIDSLNVPASDLQEDTASSTNSSELVLSVLSYAENPSERFAMIDDQLVREGDYLRAGLKVIEIQAEKVLLDQRGQKIELRL